jgi:beta-aspartyl-peptidase (threonine type)
VSTSGWAWKYPGRLGDSPIIGAGNYADNRYGAAACTGWGELSMRACTARSTVLYMKQGMGVDQACRAAFADLDDLGVDPAKVIMNMVAIDAAGGLCALSTAEERSFAFRRDGMRTFELAPRLFVTPRGL